MEVLALGEQLYRPFLTSLVQGVEVRCFVSVLEEEVEELLRFHRSGKVRCSVAEEVAVSCACFVRPVPASRNRQ